MVEASGKTVVEQVLSPEKQRKLAIAVAGAILAIAVVLAILIAARTPQYEAQARLSYTPPAAGTSSTAAATNALDNTQLALLIDRFDLYPTLRQHKPASEVVARLRGALVLSQPEAGVLQVSFRDADQDKTRAVTNGLAAVLTQYEVMTQVPSSAPSVSPRSRKQHHHDQATRRAVAASVATGALLSSPGVAELMHQVDRVDDTLQDLAAGKTELQIEQRQSESKIAALEKAERRTAGGHASGQDTVREERASIEQDLTAEKEKLAGLRDRYTDAYPDVQRTEAEITALQNRLSALPAVGGAAAESAAPTPEQAAAMDKLREEKQRIERDLGRNDAAIASEQSRRESLLEQLQIAKSRPRTAAPLPQPAAAEDAAPASAASNQAGQAEETISLPVFPFRVIESAGDAGLVTTSRLALSIWLVIGTAVLLALCFVPLVPAHYAAVVTTPEELKQGLPEHVTYLGDVGLGDVGRTEH